jgi:hypothetical protein
MARDRFSDLERIYDAIKLGKVDYKTLPQNLDFVRYAKWREGDTPVPAGSNIRPNLNGEVNVGVIAFGLAHTSPLGKILVTMTGRSATFLDGFSQKALFNVSTGESNITGYLPNGGFVPAKARIATIVSGTSETSRITGRKYKKKTGAAYTVPMGQASGGTRYQEAIGAILNSTSFKGSGANTPATHVVSFDPEEFRRD